MALYGIHSAEGIGGFAYQECVEKYHEGDQYIPASSSTHLFTGEFLDLR